MTLCLPEQTWLSEDADAYICMQGAEVIVNQRSSSVVIAADNLDFKALFGALHSKHILFVAVWEGAKIGFCCLGDDYVLSEGWHSQSIRTLYDFCDPVQLSLANRAIQLKHWLDSNQYCGRCGSPTTPHAYERALQCQRCDRLYYPQIAPCVIGVVKRGRQLLLAQGQKHPQGIYSALAGFIEAGEDAEQAFAREVKEEVGVEIKNICYLSSQPWPFPAQLMLGFVAEYASGELEIDSREIAHAAWFDIDRLPQLPADYTIAKQLIDFVVKGI